jgi:hypothetical protein
MNNGGTTNKSGDLLLVIYLCWLSLFSLLKPVGFRVIKIFIATWSNRNQKHNLEGRTLQMN